MMIEKVNNLSIYICKKPKEIESETFVRNFFEKKGYKVTKKNGSPIGIPDFFCKKDKEIFYVEVKSQNDSLRVSQIKWIKENYDKPTILFITEDKIPKELNNKLKRKPIDNCSKCFCIFKNNDLTEESEEKFCYPCLRKYLFIKHYELKYNKISNSTKNNLYDLKRELNNYDFFNKKGESILK